MSLFWHATGYTPFFRGAKLKAPIALSNTVAVAEKALLFVLLICCLFANSNVAMWHVTSRMRCSMSLGAVRWNICTLKHNQCTHAHNRHQYKSGQNLWKTRVFDFDAFVKWFAVHARVHTLCRCVDRTVQHAHYAIHHIDLCIGSLCQCTVANQCTHCACCFIRFSCRFFFLLLLNSLTGAIDSRSRALRTDSDQKFKQLLLIITL